MSLDMNDTIRSSSFTRIKEGFHPAFTYLVFEMSGRAMDGACLDNLLSSLSGAPLRVLEQKSYRCGPEARLLSVLKLASDTAEPAVEALLESPIPEGLTLYVYNGRK